MACFAPPRLSRFPKYSIGRRRRIGKEADPKTPRRRAPENWLTKPVPQRLYRGQTWSEIPVVPKLFSKEQKSAWLSRARKSKKDSLYVNDGTFRVFLVPAYEKIFIFFHNARSDPLYVYVGTFCEIRASSKDIFSIQKKTFVCSEIFLPLYGNDGTLCVLLVSTLEKLFIFFAAVTAR